MSLFDTAPDRDPAADQLIKAVQQGISTEDGFATIQYALQQAGYSISPSYRRTYEEWGKKLEFLFPTGHVNMLDNPKSTKPVFGEIVNLIGGGPDSPVIAIATYDAPDVIFSLKKAKVVHDSLHGLVELNGPRKNVILLPAHNFMV